MVCKILMYNILRAHIKSQHTHIFIPKTCIKLHIRVDRMQKELYIEYYIVDGKITENNQFWAIIVMQP